MAAKSKKEETDIFDLLKDLVKNWHIMLPCIILSGIMGVFAAMWIRPVYQQRNDWRNDGRSGKPVCQLQPR